VSRGRQLRAWFVAIKTHFTELPSPGDLSLPPNPDRSATGDSETISSMRWIGATSSLTTEPHLE